MALANIAGLDYESTVIEFNVRPAPGTVPDQVSFKAQKGAKGLEILDVQPDNQGATRPDGQVYQWFKLKFPNGQEGWLRGHILTIEGDLTRFGYGVVSPAVYAYKLNRVMPTAAPTPPAAPVAPAPATPKPATPAPTAASEVSTAPKPAAPAPAPVPVTPAPTPVTPAPTAPVSTSGLCVGKVTAGGGAKLRKLPVTGGEITIIPFDSVVTVLEVKNVPGEIHRWVRLRFDKDEGWTRQDLMSYTGDCARFNLSVTSTTPAVEAEFAAYTGTALYPVPMKRYRFVRGFTGHQPNHPGVDYGGDEGEPMLAGPVGGLVVAVEECIRCNVPGKPSTKLQGLGLANANVFTDKGWNFGFGHYIIVRYLNHQLPAQTKQALVNMGRGGQHIYAMYAHLQGLGDIKVGAVLAPNQSFTFCGNTGNSDGSHLHLELRADSRSKFPGWATIKDGLVDPLIMFPR